MENAAYIGLSRQMTLRRELDIVANNIANADTTGFKVEQLLVGTEVGERARNDFDPARRQLRAGQWRRPRLRPGRAETDGPRPGLRHRRRRGLLHGLQDGQGEAYTRDGAFTVDPEGRLVTKAGLPVQGDGGEIILDPLQGPATSAPTARSARTACRSAG